MDRELETRLDEIEARLAEIAGALQLVLNSVAIQVPRGPGGERNWPMNAEDSK